MGAEPTVAIMTAAAVAPIVADGTDVVQLTSLAALLVGGWCILGLVFRLGFISDLLSRPILAGYVYGSGIIIVMSQLESLFGLEIDESLYSTDILAIVRNLGDIHGLTTLIGIATIIPVPGVPTATFSEFTQLLLPALGIALLAYPDSFLTARSLATARDYEIDADQEFLAIGMSNVASGFLQGIPVNGSQ